ncbi:WD40-repeat-containing domain protein [Kockovaella imperatae]|uniref:WD40-repeat-containing domain protein n=1 Tax=Kockovaella imperatae TaxID=4999 RepID=A0A1Y1UJM2_9TREE|nr:WD40-repeat-containing domain protein [Kockovaella imperatae]ORX37704.1 WD40-repeat-containing domain protein [Kockovaella imperatae]
MSTGDQSLQPPADGISALAFSADSQRLLVASWDGSIQLHELTIPPTAPRIFTHPAAVLSVTFGSSSNTAFSGGLDKRVREWNFETGQCRVLGKHDDAVSSIVWCPEKQILLTGSWDQTLKVWTPSSDSPLTSSHNLPNRIYSIAHSPATSKVLVSMAHRHVWVFDAGALASAAQGQTLQPEQQRESALKFLTRSIALMADGKGWASGSIEGRIAVEYVDPDPAAQAQKYAFRAHRQNVDGVDCVYPVNALAYHPQYNTFASGGSDGFISIWDHSAKKRMKLYSKYPTAISSLAFSPDGSKLAIGASYEHDNAVNESDRGTVMLLIKDTVNVDCKPKPKA